MSGLSVLRLLREILMTRSRLERAGPLQERSDILKLVARTGNAEITKAKGGNRKPLKERAMKFIVLYFFRAEGHTSFYQEARKIYNNQPLREFPRFCPFSLRQPRRVPT